LASQIILVLKGSQPKLDVKESERFRSNKLSKESKVRIGLCAKDSGLERLQFCICADEILDNRNGFIQSQTVQQLQGRVDLAKEVLEKNSIFFKSHPKEAFIIANYEKFVPTSHSFDNHRNKNRLDL
jgi:hypothetical protein